MGTSSGKSLWELLGFASRKRASEGFADAVVDRSRRVRQHGRGGSHSTSPWLMAGGAMAAALVLTLFIIPVFSPPANSPIADSNPEEPILVESPLPDADWSDEYEVIEFMDQFLAVNDPSELSDAAIAELLF